MTSDDESEQPEYELADLGPPAGGDVSAEDVSTGEPGKPVYELVDHSPPPPNDQVIEARFHRLQRTWLLGTFIGVFVIVTISDIALSSTLPVRQWDQLRPEIDDVRNSMFSVLLVIIGYYFGERKNR